MGRARIFDFWVFREARQNVITMLSLQRQADDRYRLHFTCGHIHTLLADASIAYDKYKETKRYDVNVLNLEMRFRGDVHRRANTILP